MTMKMPFVTIALGTTMMVAVPATAGDRHGWYMGFDAAWSTVEHASLEIPTHETLEFNDSAAGFGMLGFAFDNGFRLEGEIGFRNNDLISVNDVPADSGKLLEWSGMLNLRYDVPVAARWHLEFGLGAGVDRARFTDHLGETDTDTAFAVQLLAGFVHELSPTWDLNLTYRFLKADNETFLIAGAEHDMDIEKHAVSVGLRYGYDEPPAAAAPPPPPPPAPPATPATPKQFVVFFGFGKCSITSEADAVLSEAAATAKSLGSASVRIVGHTDTVGSAAYNEELSQCRANATKSNLVGKGVAEGSISSSGRGETELMVQTGDGVKEPQNRRATVDLN